MRIPTMRQILVLSALCSVTLLGCGGGGGNQGGFSGPGVGSVSGVVYDQNGNIVRNAQVFFSLGQGNSTITTTSNSNGAYVLNGLPASADLIQSTLVSNNVSYFGQNIGQLSNGERTMTVNLALYPQNQLCSLQGSVTDLNGNPIPGAMVSAIPAGGKLLNSAYGLTSYGGSFAIGGLLGGAPYNIQVSALDYNGVSDTKTLTAGQSATVSYSMAPAATTTLAAPAGMHVVAFTSWYPPTSQQQSRRAFEAIKAITHPELVQRSHAAPATVRPQKVMHKVVVREQVQGAGSGVEMDVTWTPESNLSLLGYNIYWAANGAALENIDFLPDPLGASYEDQYGGLTPGDTYTYAITTISTSYNGQQGESPMSASVSATPLGQLALGTATSGASPVFTWQAANGAASYAVYIFSQYPDVGVSDIFDNSKNPVSGTAYTYNGPALTSGQTYYYIVVGSDASGDESVSQVGQFTD